MGRIHLGSTRRSFYVIILFPVYIDISHKKKICPLFSMIQVNLDCMVRELYENRESGTKKGCRRWAGYTRVD
jgi:hypothetical protein